METLLTKNIVSMTELREPAKAIEKSNGQPFAVLNRNQVVGYFVPINAVQEGKYTIANQDLIQNHIDNRKQSVKQVLEYLKDK